MNFPSTENLTLIAMGVAHNGKKALNIAVGLYEDNGIQDAEGLPYAYMVVLHGEDKGQILDLREDLIGTHGGAYDSIPKYEGGKYIDLKDIPKVPCSDFLELQNTNLPFEILDEILEICDPQD